jgi:hypothetical protein
LAKFNRTLARQPEKMAIFSHALCLRQVIFLFIFLYFEHIPANCSKAGSLSHPV